MDGLSRGVRKISQKMFDGREIIYFDDPSSALPAERANDSRPAAERAATAEMRQDPLTGEWISIAAARQARVFLPPAHLDPLAPATADNPSEIPSNYDVVVFENKSPSFGPNTLDGDPGLELEQLSTIGIGRVRPSVGRCEVVCFSPEQDGSFATLSRERARTVVEAWADRTAALSAIPGVQQVFIFENRGQEIGVTLHHPHGQIYSYPFVTPKTRRLLESIDAYGPHLMADVLNFERSSDRVVLAGTHFTAFVPFAARWPLEIHMLPHRHVPNFTLLTPDEREELARMQQDVLRGLDEIYDSPTPYIAAWHQAPVNVGGKHIRMMLQITSPRRAADKLKYLAGSESAMGAFIGDVLPEASAAIIRAAISEVQHVGE